VRAKNRERLTKNLTKLAFVSCALILLVSAIDRTEAQDGTACPPGWHLASDCGCLHAGCSNIQITCLLDSSQTSQSQSSPSLSSPSQSSQNSNSQSQPSQEQNSQPSQPENSQSQPSQPENIGSQPSQSQESGSSGSSASSGVDCNSLCVYYGYNGGQCLGEWDPDELYEGGSNPPQPYNICTEAGLADIVADGPIYGEIEKLDVACEENGYWCCCDMPAQSSQSQNSESGQSSASVSSGSDVTPQSCEDYCKTLCERIGMGFDSQCPCLENACTCS
jgi:DNA mismatch repair ATPase MutL